MRRVLFTLAITAFLCFTIACQQSEQVASEPKADVQADIQAIKDIVADFNVALNTGDIDKASFHHADEAIVIPTNRPLLIGKDASIKDLQQLFEQFTFREVDIVKDVQVSGDLAVTYYTWKCETTPKAGGEPTNANGNGIMVLRKQSDGTWKFIYFIWSNESLVSPEQPAFFSSPATLGTTDPIIGTWKLNAEKSIFPPGTEYAMKEQTLVVQELGDKVEFSFSGIQRGGSTQSSKYTRAKVGGKVTRQPPPPEGTSFVDTVINPGEWFVTVMQNGIQVGVYHWVVSRDGKTISETSVGKNADARVAVYDKQ